MSIDQSQNDAAAMLANLVARQAIHDALMRYCRGIDRCDDAMVLSAFHADAVDNHTGVDAFVATRVPRVLARARTAVKWTSHNITTHYVEVEGNVANSEACLIAIHRAEHEGREIDWMLGARYLDRFELRNGDWRIARRTVVYDWQRFDDVAPLPSGLEDASFIDGALRGQRNRDDFSYQLLRA